MTEALQEPPPLIQQESNGNQQETFDFSPWHELPGLPQALPVANGGGEPAKVHTVGPMARLCAVFILLAALPFMAIIALIVKLDSPRSPIFYRQERVGLDRRRSNGSSPVPSPAGGGERRRNPAHGKPFMIWKFRTMVPEAEKATGPVWASDRDPRVTRVGRVLRQLRLDELPQVFNLLAGQMSLIGPRPERPFFVTQLTEGMPDYPRRLNVPPGITGLAQVEKQYDTSVDDVRTKLGYDIFYVDHKCRLLDLKILLKTVDVVLRGRGAR